MKRFLLCLLILCVMMCAVACGPQGVRVGPFSVQAGEAAWQQVPDPTMPTAELKRVTLPEGLHFVADWGDLGIEVYTTQDDGTVLFGLWRDGQMVLPCRYVAMRRNGQYIFTQFYGPDEVYMDVRDREGEVIAGTTDSTAGLYALGDYFVLYTDSAAQMFDSQGNACFADGVLSAGDAVSVCGDYVLTANTAMGMYSVWQLYASQRGVMAFLRHRFYDETLRYQVAYVGNRFLVTAIGEGTAQDYTYIEVQEGVAHYMRQQAWWYDATRDTLAPARLDYVLLSVKNKYTPGIGEAEVRAMHLNEGYSVAVVAECNDYKVHEGERYYAINGDANLWVRYPAGINPTAIFFRDGVGFVGSAAGGSAAVLYDMAGNLLWQRRDYAYATMTWQGGRMVCSRIEDGVLRYGALDEAGNVVIDYVYDYMSPFFDGKCVARREGQYYLLNGAGAMVEIVSLAGNEQWLAYGLYAFERDGKMGVRNLAGQELLDARFGAIEAVGMDEDGHPYVVAVAEEGGRTQIVLQ